MEAVQPSKTPWLAYPKAALEAKVRGKVLVGKGPVVKDNLQADKPNNLASSKGRDSPSPFTIPKINYNNR